ncbi:hypothetical protein GCM10027187_40560 [Streptosporangium sandarakinum]|uniref:Uncharacterized protein n=1 Tax=Streptosporangium sandarakinum TaxID=1260955 RepID=A0A852VC32_9ACTN|nr:hypothetical protein [Streptosporangium sandarakinum]NYF44614.1 hypothetical protein [Streptosporangium sandarakinum]
MSTYEKQMPIHRVRCDATGCNAEFEARYKFDRRYPELTRQEASRAGWDVPPPRGKGSRSKEDFCPEHRRR